MTIPPSTYIICPVTKSESPDAGNIAVSTRSLGSSRFLIDCTETVNSNNCALSFLFRLASEAVNSGPMALTLIPAGPSAPAGYVLGCKSCLCCRRNINTSESLASAQHPKRYWCLNLVYPYIHSLRSMFMHIVKHELDRWGVFSRHWNP